MLQSLVITKIELNSLVGKREEISDAVTDIELRHGLKHDLTPVPISDHIAVIEAEIRAAIDLVALKVIGWSRKLIIGAFGGIIPVERDLFVPRYDGNTRLVRRSREIVVVVVDLLYRHFVP